MATLAENSPNAIRFVNNDGSEESPTLLITAGDWQADGHVETGIVFDTFGDQAPILTPTDARKLAKWLTRAADLLDGNKQHDKKNKPKRHYDDEEDNEYKW